VISTYKAAPDIDVITSPFPIPGFGFVPINAFVLHGSEPLLVDTGAIAERDEFMDVLRSVIDPADLRWLYLTHTDFDHIGNLHRLLDENPKIRLITSFLGVGIMTLTDKPLPMERLYLLNPGQSVTVGDRTLHAVKPPVFDNPSTTGFVDEGSGTLFSSDCFGALLQAVPESAADISPDELRQGQQFWASLDSPWLHKVDAGVFAKELAVFRDIQPTTILSSHLPAAPGTMIDTLVASLESVPASPPFVGPDQAALEAMLAQMTGDGPPQ
jgi:flavorubredoxin